jgi:chromosome segregation ATPase
MSGPEFWTIISVIVASAGTVVAFAALMHKIRNTRGGEIKAEIVGVRSELRTDLDLVRAELRSDLEAARRVASAEHDELAAQVRDISHTIAEHYFRRAEVDGDFAGLRDAIAANSAAIGALGATLNARIDQLFERVQWAPRGRS